MQKHPIQTDPYPITIFFDAFCFEVIGKFMHHRKSQLSYTVFQTATSLIIIYQNNELNLGYHREYINVQWWEGYHRFNGQQHPDYPLTQLKRSYYKIHNSGKVFKTSLPEEPFNGHTLTPIPEATDGIVRQFIRQGPALHISLWQHNKP